MNGRHGGNVKHLARKSGRTVDEILDFSASINPLGPPGWLPELVRSLIGSLVHYPDPHCTSLIKAAAESRGLREEEIVAGNGSSELLYLLPRVLKETGRAKRALIPVPAYGDYAVAAALAGLAIERLPLKEEEDFVLDPAGLEGSLKEGDAVFLGQPSNPTGYACDPGELRTLALRHPEATFVIDEAFADFIDGLESLTVRRPPNVVVLCSLTKFYAVPGLRLGYAVAGEETVTRLRELIPPWSLNTLAQAVGEKALRDGTYAERSRKAVLALREQFSDRLRRMPGFTVYPGKANYLLVRVDGRAGGKTPDAREIARRLLSGGIAVRLCENMDGLDERFFRIAVRTEEENGRFLRVLENALHRSGKTGGAIIPFRNPPPRPAVMFQGTCSHAGKSVLAAALCRILLEDGYRVAPFKAQNMSLNSFVTPDGGEIGRAQAVQAQACRIEPDVRMNPLLLKPSTDTGSQVILLGKPVANMDFREYTRHHEQYLEATRTAYDSLSRDYDVMVLEGAGSPAEVNLMHHDIANMKTARHARAPVLLVGNIDRGGVYASFVGTLDVLPEAERALIAGFIVNRFRGTASLLDDAHEYVTQRTGCPVLGVVPELFDLGLPEEDSVGFRQINRADGAGDRVDIAVVGFAHISNFTDLDPLRIEPDVHLRIVRTPRELGVPDAVILPGSKNVAADLAFLKSSGLGEKLLSLAASGQREIIGICGGFQMLGRTIADPHAIESAGATVEGIGLLPLSTLLAQEKLLARTSALHLTSGHTVSGYEIHHGRTEGMERLPLMEKPDGALVGAGTEDGLVWGTYLHGVFDADGFRRWFIDRLRVRRGLAPQGKVVAVYDLEPVFERLAGTVRAAIDIDRIYRIMGLR
jgi:adenosylcobyric acid synthase